MTRHHALVVFLASCLLAAACGGDAPGATAPATTATTAAAAEPRPTTAATAEPTTSTGAPTTTATTSPAEPAMIEPLPETTAWVAFADGTLARIDLATGEAGAEVWIGPVDEMEHGLGTVWAISCEEQTLVGVDAYGMTVVGTWDLGACPADLAVTEDSVLLALTDADEIVSLDPLTGEITTLVETPSPTAIDAGSPILYGGADGTITLNWRNDDGSITEEWSVHYAGDVVSVFVDDYWWPFEWHLDVLMRGRDGKFFVVSLDPDTGDLVDSWDPDVEELWWLVVWGDWFFAGGDRVWHVGGDGGDGGTTAIPDPVDGAIDPSSTGTPGAYVVSSPAGVPSSVFRMDPETGEADRVTELPATGATQIALPSPASACSDQDMQAIRSHVGENAWKLDARMAGSWGGEWAELAYAVKAEAEDLLGGLTEGDPGWEDLDLAVRKAQEAIDIRRQMRALQQEMREIDHRVQKGCSPAEMLEMSGRSFEILDEAERRFHAMEGSANMADVALGEAKAAMQ